MCITTYLFGSFLYYNQIIFIVYAAVDVKQNNKMVLHSLPIVGKTIWSWVNAGWWCENMGFAKEQWCAEEMDAGGI